MASRRVFGIQADGLSVLGIAAEQAESESNPRVVPRSTFNLKNLNSLSVMYPFGTLQKGWSLRYPPEFAKHGKSSVDSKEVTPMGLRGNLSYD